jgi:hypothetical protein
MGAKLALIVIQNVFSSDPIVVTSFSTVILVTLIKL